MKILVVLGTSYSRDSNYNSYKHNGYANPTATGGIESFIQYLEKKLVALGLFDKVVDAAIGAYGIDTYNARIFNILQQHKDDDVSFLCEIPGPDRGSLNVLENSYNAWEQISKSYYWKQEHIPHKVFWSSWADGLTYNQLAEHYSKIKTSTYYQELQEIADKTNDMIPSPEMMHSWNTMRITTNISLEIEEIIMQAFVINQFLKSNKHPVAWWSLDVDYKNGIDILNNTFQTNCFDSISKEFMLNVILNKYNREIKDKGLTNKENNLDLFPDKAHPTSLILKDLADDYFVPYYVKGETNLC